MNKNQKGLVPIIIVLIVIALISGGILAWQYFGVPKKEVKAPEEKVPEEIVQDETADWETYKNEVLELVLEKIGFVIKYPNNWGYVIIGKLNPLVFFGPQDIIDKLESGESVDDKSLGVMISVYEKDLYERGILPYKKSNEYLSITSSKIEVDKVPGTYYILEHLVSRLGYQTGDKTITVDLVLNNGYLSIHLFNYQYLDIFEKMLSTFRFIKPEQKSVSEGECVGEGEFKCTVMGCLQCCSGLVDRYVTEPMRDKNNENEVVCIEEMTMIKCVKCGDGICGKGENWCICPEDCQKPNPEDLEASF